MSIVMEHVKEVIRGIRNIRAEMNVPNNRKDKRISSSAKKKKLTKAIEGFKQSVMPLMMAVRDHRTAAEKRDIADDAVSIVVPDAVSISAAWKIWWILSRRKRRLTKEEERLNKEIKRAKGMLANEKFVSKAPEAKVQEEREKLEKYDADAYAGTGENGRIEEIE